MEFIISISLMLRIYVEVVQLGIIVGLNFLFLIFLIGNVVRLEKLIKRKHCGSKLLDQIYKSNTFVRKMLRLLIGFGLIFLIPTTYHQQQQRIRSKQH